MITKITVLAIYVAILFLIGILASRRVKSMSDFYLGGKNMGFWAVAFSARATGESGWLLIGLTGMGAIAGYSGYWVVAGELLGVFLSWQFMAKRFKRRSDKYNAITIPDYLQSHFKSSSNTLRIIAASVLVVFVVIYVASQMDVTGVAFESMLNIPYKIGALIGFAIVLAYIFIGGFVAAVWSDMFQGILMFFGLILLPIVVWFSMDQGTGVTEGLNAIDPTLTQVMGRSEDGWMNLFTILGFSMIGLGFLGSPQVYVRFMSIKSEKEIDKGKWVALLFTLLTDNGAITAPGSPMLAVIREGDMEIEVPIGANEIDLVKDEAQVVLYDEIGSVAIGKVNRKGTYINPQTQTVPVFIDIIESSVDLYNGMYLNAEIQCEGTTSMIELPRKALFNKNEVYVVENGRIFAEKVDISLYLKNTVLIKGVADNTVIVLEPILNAKDSMEVKVINPTK
jgi:uncharacterized sodium:solute symporter family permease YidK